MTTPARPNQFRLLTQRRFAPFFWTQFFGAANDNLFKFALTVMVTYQLQVSWLPPAQAGLVIGAVFMLPYLLLSAFSGQLSDKMEKSALIRRIKEFEIAIMALATWALLAPSPLAGLLVILLLGVHSTLFGPVKYAYLPQQLTERELTGGNGMVEMGTFAAILLGNLAGGLLVAIPGIGKVYVAIGCLMLALLGRLSAGFIPPSPATDPTLGIDWNPFTGTWRNLKAAHENRVVFRSIAGISWMWAFGAVFLANFPAFASQVLRGNEQVAALLLATFSIGIAVGSLMCESLSRRHVEIGLVPIGAIGMSVFAIDLFFAVPAPAAAGPLLGVRDFVAQPGHLRVLFDLAMVALSAGIFSVPMYALIQIRSRPTHRARIIAANNVMNGIFMVLASVICGVLLAVGVSIPQLFLLLGLFNVLVAIYIVLLVPEYLLRFIAFMLSRVIYRFRVSGEEHIPEEGAAIVVANHVSFVDAVLLMAASPRPIRFIMDHRIFATPLIGPVFRLARAIPIAPRAEDPVAYEAAFEAAAQVLSEDDLLGIFPEGAITRDGQLQPFKGGIMKILEANPVPVVPVALTNLWGSFFSRIEHGTAMVKPFRRGFFNRVGLVAGPPIAAADVTLDVLEARVTQLLGLPPGFRAGAVQASTTGPKPTAAPSERPGPRP